MTSDLQSWLAYRMEKSTNPRKNLGDLSYWRFKCFDVCFASEKREMY